MSTPLKVLLEKLMDGVDLSEREAEQLLNRLTDETTSDVQRAAVLTALRCKGETADEVRGLAMGMRRAAVQVRPPEDLVIADTCGTGGDGSGSFNVSTAAAILVAAAGVPVVKHGNRSVSSKCGSADVLEKLGVRLATDPYQARSQLVDVGFTFLFAPAFHPSTKAVSGVRRSLGVRTVFNLLGPLTNPAWPKHQLVGAWSADAARLMAQTLAKMPIERCIVVHGTPSWDEATPCGPFLRIDVTPGTVSERFVDPQIVYGVDRADPSELAGGDVATNAQLMQDVFSGARSANRDAVLLNAALVLELVGKADTPEAAFALASDTLDSGRATWFLERLGTGR